MSATNTKSDTAQSHDHSSHDNHGHHPSLAHHFVSLEQQHEANILGMWMFLVTEVLFFGGLFTAYTVYRLKFNTMFQEASNQLDITLGCLNTVVLILSSLTMAMAVRSAQIGKTKQILNYLGATAILGFMFLGVKYFEWKHDFDIHLVPKSDFCWDYAKERRKEADHHEKDQPFVSKLIGKFVGHHEEHAPPSAAEIAKDHKNPESQQARIFFVLYFAMTGIHALHMVIGFGLIAAVAYWASRGTYGPEYYTPVEVLGLYWHFVDIVWIFLFPLLYLLGAHLGAGH